MTNLLLPEFVHIATIVNPTNGELVPVDTAVHRDDIDWLVRLWQDSFTLDWEIQCAAEQRAAGTKARMMKP